jgi:hypothetical protein
MAVKVPAKERIDNLFNMAVLLSNKYDNDNGDNNLAVDTSIGMYIDIYI